MWLKRNTKFCLATTATVKAKINEVKSKIPNITNLPTNTALTAAKNKIPDHSKYITIPEFNKLKAENFTVISNQANLATKGDITDSIQNTDFVDKLKR